VRPGGERAAASLLYWPAVPVAAQSDRVPSDSTAAFREVEANIARVLRGKPDAIRYALTALLARGHLLIEDIPGVGKTTLARAVATSLGGTFNRIQFTSDLLPSDIIGVSMYDRERHAFEFRRGPIFANVVVADEINRTTPRTQSALLEAMSEGHVSVDDTTHRLGRPFLVLATQNPAEHFGTYPLPESQMDRFLLRIRIGYPAPEIERQILLSHSVADPIESLGPVIDLDTVRALQDQVEHIVVDERLVDYALRVVNETRAASTMSIGVSTRGALAWYRAAQAYAMVDGRQFCIPDDFKALAVPALAHRIVLSSQQDSLGRQREESEAAIAEILARVPAPV
jgi:MoxR-like ATPase